MDNFDGGPAFPNGMNGMASMDEHGKVTSLGSDGMSLRDWFAGQALAGMSADPSLQGSWVEIADKAYGAAEAMLARRMKT